MAKTGHPNFVYAISSPWRTQRHVWSLTGNHSGSSLNSGDAETFMTGAASPFALSFAPFLTAAPDGATTYAQFDHQVVRAAYYNGQDSAPVWEADYDATTPAPSTLLPTATGPSGAAVFDPYGSLEACLEMRAPVGLSSTNKPVFVRKYIHGLPSQWVATNIDGVQTIALSSAGTAALAAMSNGDWFGSRVYIARSGNQPAASDWVVLPGAHQMPRGRRKVTAKAGASAQNSLLNLLEAGAIGIGSNLLTDAL